MHFLGVCLTPFLNSASAAYSSHESSVSGQEKKPKDKVFGRDAPGTSGTHTSGYPSTPARGCPDKNSTQGAFFC